MAVSLPKIHLTARDREEKLMRTSQDDNALDTLNPNLLTDLVRQIGKLSREMAITHENNGRLEVREINRLIVIATI